MQLQSLTFAALALFGISNAVPVQLPASQNTQVDIINLQATIVNLANDISQKNVAGAKSDYNIADSQFKTIGTIVKTPTDYSCPPPTSNGRITEAETAIEALNTTQLQLSTLSLHLQDTASSNDLINSDFCSAYTNLQGISYFIFSVFGTTPTTLSLTASGYDPAKLGETYQASLVALEALISALNTVPGTQQTKDAYTKAQTALSNYGEAANPGTGSCPYVKFPAVHTAKEAISYVYETEYAVQDVYADTAADNGEAHGDFCRINAYMTAVEGFVQA